MKPGDSVFIPIIATKKEVAAALERIAIYGMFDFHIVRRHEGGFAGYRVWRVESRILPPSTVKRYEKLQTLSERMLGPQHNLLPSALKRSLLALASPARKGSDGE